MTTLIPPHTVHQWLASGEAVLVDVREPSEHAKKSIPGAVNIPIGQLPQGLPELQGKKLVLHCGGGGRAGRACAAVLAAEPEFPVHNLEGGLRGWEAAGLPVALATDAEPVEEGRFCLTKPLANP